MRFISLGVILLLGLPVGTAAAREKSATTPKAVSKWMDSVALVQVVRNGSRASRGTGFVCLGADGKKILVTAAHILKHVKEGEYVAAFLNEYKGMRPFKVVARSDEHDLAILRPEEDLPRTPAFSFKQARTFDSLRVRNPVFVLGSPAGLEPTAYGGEISATYQWQQFAKKLISDKTERLEKLPRLRDDLNLVRHNAFGGDGMSGGPVVDEKGCLIGVHHGILEGFSHVSLCIHGSYLPDLKPGKQTGPAPVPKTPPVVKAQALTDKSSKTSKLLGLDRGQLNCYHHGYVTGSADEVIDAYVQDARSFRSFIKTEKVEKLLANPNKVAHITNPGLGFQMLVPKGYRITMEEVQGGNGIKITFIDGEELDEKKFNYVRVYVYKNEYADLVVRDQVARRDAWLDAFGKKYKLPKLPKMPKMEKPSPELQAFLNRMSRGREFKSLFFTTQLGLSMDFSHLLRNGDKPTKAPPVKAEKDILRFSIPWQDVHKKHYSESVQMSSPDGTFVWDRYNLDAVDGSDAHAVHIAPHGRVLVIVHFRFNQRDRKAMIAGKFVDYSFLQRVFIARSVSLY